MRVCAQKKIMGKKRFVPNIFSNLFTAVEVDCTISEAFPSDEKWLVKPLHVLGTSWIFWPHEIFDLGYFSH